MKKLQLLILLSLCIFAPQKAWSNMLQTNTNQYTVTWHVLTTSTTTTIAEGDPLTIPDNINTEYCDASKIFVGWTDTPIEEQTDTPPSTLFSIPTGNVTSDAHYYAVFATKGKETCIATADWTENVYGWKQSNENSNNNKNDYGAVLTHHACNITSPDLKDEYQSIIVRFRAGKIGNKESSTLRFYIYNGNNFIEYKEFTPTEDHKSITTINELFFTANQTISSVMIYRFGEQADIVIKSCDIYGITLTGYTTSCSFESIEQKTVSNETWAVTKNTDINTLDIKENGIVTVAENCTLTIQNLSIASNFSNKTSGQLIVHGAVEAQHAYHDITLGNNANPNQWHAFTVPFPVDAINGVYDSNNNPLTNEVNYAIMDYHGDIRAKGQYAWKKYRGILVPGTFYIMTVDGTHTTYRFKKVEGAKLLAENTKSLTAYTGNGKNTDIGWNGVGNPTMTHGSVAHDALILNPETYTYKAVTSNSSSFIVGTPFFIQVDADNTMTLQPTTSNLAPARHAAAAVEDIKLAFANNDYTDYLYVSASEDAINAYQIGKDLAKMSMTPTPSVPQIAAMAYDTRLCIIDAPMLNNETNIALHLYAPAQGDYTLAIEEHKEADIYLMYEGKIVQNIAANKATISLSKGENTAYSLLIRKKITTHIPTVNNAENRTEKLLYKGQLFILHEGKVFDSMGNSVK